MLSTFAGLLSRRRTTVALLLLGLIAATAVLVLGPTQATTPVTPTSGLVAGADSTVAAARLAAQPGGPVSPAVVVVSRPDGGPLTPADRRAVAAVAAAVPSALRGGDAAGPQGPAEVRRNVAVVVVPLRASLSDEREVQVVDALRAAVRKASGSLRAEVTGQPAVDRDLSAVFDGADGRLLLVTVGVVAVLLLLTYRSPVLWLLPLVTVALADRVAVALVGATAPTAGVPVDQAAEGILSVLVFGAGTDYALLLVARYRDELRVESDRFAAMATALRRTAPAVLASGGTVVLSLLTLTLADLTSLRGLGYACAVGVAVAMAAALVVLPPLLVLPGRWLFWPRVPRAGEGRDPGRVWSGVGELVTRRPRRVAVCGLALLTVAAAALGTAHLGLSADQQFVKAPESVVAARHLSLGLPAGAAAPLVVIGGQEQAVVRRSLAVPGVASATPSDGAVQVVLDAAPGTARSDQAIGELRSALRGTAAHVGGDTATTYDAVRANEHDTAVVVPLVLLVVALVLLVLLRSVTAAAVLVGTVVVSFAGALGAAWLLLDATYGFPAFDVGVPLLSFLFLVALGVDYNIFLVERARELVDDGEPTGQAIVSALASTGPVITSAGVLLAAVFAVLGVLPLITLTQIGVVVGLGVLLDTLLVRTLVVPALVVLLGDRFWWPRTIRRPVPERTAVRV